MLVDCFLTVTPCRRTSSGSIGSAIATRFCTSTWAASRLVPISNVTVSEYAPSLGRGRHVEHVLHAVDLLLDRRGDGVGHDLGVGAGILRRHLHRRRRDLGILLDRQPPQRDGADQNRDHRDHVRKDRPLDEEPGKHRRQCFAESQDA